MWNFWKQLRCVAHSPLILGMTIALLFSLGTCIVQIQNVRVNFAFTKRLQSLGGSDDQCPQCASVCQVRNILFEDQTNSFLSFGQGVYIFEESPKSIQDVIGDVYCPGKYCSNRELRISWRLCNNSEIHFWLWKLWSLIVCSQSSFYVTRARKDDRNRQNTLFSLLK